MIKKIVGLIGLVMCWSGSLIAQRENTVFQSVFTDLDTDQVFSAPIQNIGQSSHLMMVLLKDAPGQTCSAPAITDIGLEYSYDNQVYVRAENAVTRILANEDGVLSKVQNLAGAFPYVRVAIRDFDTVNCRLDVSYSGAIAAFNVNNVATNNNFLGINAVTTLASDNGLNIQFTSSAPIVKDLNNTSSGTFVRSLYDALEDSSWIKVSEVNPSHSGGIGFNMCAGTQNGTITFGDSTTGTTTFTATGANTGYTNSTFQCNFNANIVVDIISNNNPLVSVVFENNLYTYTTKSPYTGFRGNFIPVNCSSGMLCDSLGFSSANNLLKNGKTTWKTQTTPQGLNGCLVLNGYANNRFSVTGMYDNCNSEMVEMSLVKTNSGNQVRVWIDDYQIFSFIPTVNPVSTAQMNTTWAFGVPYVPPFVNAVTEFIWFWGDNKQSTSDIANTWRGNVLASNTASSSKYGMAVAYNGVTYAQSSLNLLTFNPIANWVNSSGAPLSDAIVKFQVGGPAGTNALIGQLWNALYYQVNTPCDTDFLIDGEIWRTFTCNSNNGTLMLLQP